MTIIPATIQDSADHKVGYIEVSVVDDSCRFQLRFEKKQLALWQGKLSTLQCGRILLQLDDRLRFIEKCDESEQTRFLEEYLNELTGGELKLVYNADEVIRTRLLQKSLRMQRPYTVPFHELSGRVRKLLRATDE